MLKKITFSVPSPFRTPSLVALTGKNVWLKFYLTKDDLYTLISPCATGESCGYTAGGDPSLSGDGIEIK